MPRKSIKIDGAVYERLREVRGKEESFSECISRLISIVETIKDVYQPHDRPKPIQGLFR